MDLERELQELLNRHCAENQSNTPDFILAEFMKFCLNSFNLAVEKRDKWYGVHLEPAHKYFLKEENA